MRDPVVEPAVQPPSPKQKGPSNRNIEYKCDYCGRPTSRSALKVKRTQFKEMGEGGAVLVTRTIAWLCLSCMEADPDYNRPAFSASPGLRDTKMANG